jgi:hypothetical protein
MPRGAANYVISMRSFFCAALLGCTLAGFTGCGGVTAREHALTVLSPQPMNPAQWQRVTGLYAGPIRAATTRFGYEALSVRELRMEISGTAEEPLVFLKMQTSHAGAWTAYSEKTETFTNISERRYGTQGYVFASSHAPDQLLLRLRANGVSWNVRPRMILTFRGRSCIDVDWIAESGWRGEGTLQRLPIFSGACR